MSYESLPETVHTLYAELLDQVLQAEAEAIAVGLPPSGSFVSKEVKGNTYWYLQRTVAGRREQTYLGAESAELLRWIERVRKARLERRTDVRRRGELVDMLVAGGATPVAHAPGRVIQALGETGVFRLGGVLVGTHGFLVMSNVLGVRFEGRHLKTGDVDIAHDPRLEVALGPTDAPQNVPAALAGVDERFFGVPGLDPRQPSASFKIRGRDLRVDFVTPRGRGASEGPVELRRFGFAALPLEFLGYLLEDTIQAVVLYDSGILVNVPQPARFALHKLWLANHRPSAMQARARKDLTQAEALLEVLVEDRPRDLERAWQGVGDRRRRQVREGLERLEPRLREEVAKAAGLDLSSPSRPT